MFAFHKGCPLIFASRIGIVSHFIFNVKHCKERKKQRLFVYKPQVSCQRALITTVNLHFKKAKQLTPSQPRISFERSIECVRDHNYLKITFFLFYIFIKSVVNQHNFVEQFLGRNLLQIYLLNRLYYLPQDLHISSTHLRHWQVKIKSPINGCCKIIKIVDLKLLVR
jgi:hypothetical protein